MAYDIFSKYGLDKIHDSLTEDKDYKDNNESQWEIVDQKTVRDSDGFLTEYTWYTNGDKHIFMFGDSDLYDPDEDYADYTADSESEAKEWFDSYEGFSTDDDIWEQLETDTIIDDPSGNADFMNNGFSRVYGGEDLED